MIESSAKILVLGASGMLGNAVYRYFSNILDCKAYGTVRSPHALGLLPKSVRDKVLVGVDVNSPDSLSQLFAQVCPNVVINCVGLVKQISDANDPLSAIPINALLPHRLASLCKVAGARLIHVSTDCVFSGLKGMYVESDTSDANDLYGRSKYLGEVDYPHAITLRTSIIGRELAGSRSLVDWFLTEKSSVVGFKKAIFSGLPTIEIAKVICEFVIPNPDLHGVYHLSAEPISKYDLLKIIAGVYEKEIEIIENDKFIIDRSLDSTRFRTNTGFRPNAWPELILEMKQFS